MKKLLLIVLMLPLLVINFSCDSLPEASVEKAKRYKSKIEGTRKNVKKKDSLYKTHLAKVGEVSKYSTKENLPKYFGSAYSQVDIADKFYKDYVETLLEKNESKSDKMLLSRLATIDVYLNKAKRDSDYPTLRLGKLAHLNEGKEAYYSVLKDSEAKVKGIYSNMESLTAKYVEKYPLKSSEINSFKRVSETKLLTIEKIVKEFGDEYRKSDVDLTKLLDLYASGIRVPEDAKAHFVQVLSKLKELDKSYSKTLKDMKARFYVQVSRVSWDSDSDWDSENKHDYALREVDEATFKYFNELPANTVLASETGIGSGAPKVKINTTHWNKLRINHKEKYPMFDDDSEYYINNLKVKYYHLYVIENNGSVSEKWEEVSEKVFYTNLENQGMSIRTKPLGVFESEAIKEVAPAGMGYVGNPQYGQWRTNASGESFWSFYGKYMFISNMLGGHNYSRYEYDDYNRNYRNRGKVYYGSRGNHSYGTRGSVFTKSNTYKNSTYRKSYATNTKSAFSRSSLTKRKASTSTKSRGTTTPRKTYSRSSSTRSSSTRSSSRSGSSRRGGGPSRGGK
jgi:hypothetical protein